MKHLSKKRIIMNALSVALVLAALLCVTLFSATAQMGDDLADDITDDFTCSNFKAVVLDIIGKDDGIILKGDVVDIHDLDATEKNITSLDGIEHFTALRSLFASNNQLTSIDISNNLELELLDIRHNQLAALDVSNNSELGMLNVDYNQLATLDVSNNPALSMLYADGNKLTTLDISENHEIVHLCVSANRLTEIILSGSAEYEMIDVRGNFLPNHDAVTGQYINWNNPGRGFRETSFAGLAFDSQVDYGVSIMAAIKNGRGPILALSVMEGTIIPVSVLQAISDMGVDLTVTFVTGKFASIVFELTETGADVRVTQDNGFSYTVLGYPISKNIYLPDFDVAKVTPAKPETEIYGVRIPENSVLVSPITSDDFTYEVVCTISAEQLAKMNINGSDARLCHIDFWGDIADMGDISLGADGSVFFKISDLDYVFTDVNLDEYNMRGYDTLDIGENTVNIIKLAVAAYILITLIVLIVLAVLAFRSRKKSVGRV